MKSVWKFIFIMLLTVGGLLSVSLHTDAAAKPYEYTFEKDNGVTFNGTNAINKLKITFDQDITADENVLFKDSKTSNPVYIVQNGSTTPVDIIKDVTIEDNKVMWITFKNLDFIDYTGNLDYQLIIKKESLRFDQLVQNTIPFKIYDILPGFKSTFIDTSSSIINKNIFSTNAPRDVMVHVPKLYISSIETIHHYNGILPSPLPTTDANLIKDPYNDNISQKPQLTNIDVLAEPEASRLKVFFKTNDPTSEFYRDLPRRTDLQGFTMGQAGINEISNGQKEALNEFQLRAYDDNGRFLEQRNFKLRVTDPKSDYIVTDYLPKLTKEFGQTYSLYDLMSDPKLLEDIITRIPVSELDSLGITYAVGNPSVVVKNEDELKIALGNPSVSKITLNGDIPLTSTLAINRSVTIEGNGRMLQGNVTLGTGQDIDVRLNNMTITGDFTVDVGANGSAILDNVTVYGTPTIISGGMNSVHLNNFYTRTNNIILNNASPLRVVNSTNTGATIVIKGSAAVTLEGSYGTINVQNGITLNLKNVIAIGDIQLNANTAPVKIVTAEPMDNIKLGGSGIVTLEGEYTNVYVNSNLTLNTTKYTNINRIEVLNGSTLTLSGTAGTINSVHGKTIFPSGLTINAVSANAMATGLDEAYISFNKTVYKSTTRDPLTYSDFANYFTVKKNGIELSANSYAVDGLNTKFTIFLNSNIKIGDTLTIGLKDGKTLYDLNGKPISSATLDVGVTSLDGVFSTPAPTIANNQITLTFAAGDLDTSTVARDGSDFNAIGYTITSASVSGDTVTLTLNTTPPPGQYVFVRIASNNITDKVGNILPMGTIISVASAGLPSVAVDFVPGTNVGYTKAVITGTTGNNLYAHVDSTPTIVPTNGSTFSWTAGTFSMTNATEIPASVGKYINIYEVNGSNQIVGFQSSLLQTGDVK